MTFDPSKHLRPMKGGAEYLDVKWRLVWLREEHPDAEIETRNLEHEAGKWASFWARVAIPGQGSATGHGSETAADFRDYYEKAETKALGRALAALGYGTQFVGDELDEGQRIVDAPVQRPAPRAQERPAPAPPAEGMRLYPGNGAARSSQAPPAAPVANGSRPDPDAVLAILGEMDDAREPWHEIKRYADDQSTGRFGDDVLRIHDKLKAIAARRKEAGKLAAASIAG
jgi:hypothetical protein